MRRNLRIVALIVVGMLVLGAAVNVLLLTIPMPVPLYVLGGTHAGLMAAALHLVNSAFLAHDQEAVWQLRGAWGGQHTQRAPTSQAQASQLGWVDSVELQAGDIDHIIITRDGGVVVMDSRWRNQITREGVPAMADSARRAALRAEGVLRTVLERETGARHRTRAQPVSVTAAVVLCRAARTDVPSDANVDGALPGGRQLLDWLAELDGHEVPSDAANDVLKLLTDYRSTAVTTPK